MYSPKDLIQNVDYSLDAAVTLFDFFNSLYEISYPLPKLGKYSLTDTMPSYVSKKNLCVIFCFVITFFIRDERSSYAVAMTEKNDQE